LPPVEFNFKPCPTAFGDANQYHSASV